MFLISKERPAGRRKTPALQYEHRKQTEYNRSDDQLCYIALAILPFSDYVLFFTDRVFWI